MAIPPQRPGAKGQAILQDARAQEDAARQDRHRTETLQEQCAELEEDLEVLRARFDLYFIGIERREPARERGEIRRRVARLKGEQTHNTGLRFRIETLNARHLSYERVWTRSAREKEAGTYHRDLVRARRRAELAARREAAAGGVAGAAAGEAARAGPPGREPAPPSKATADEAAAARGSPPPAAAPAAPRPPEPPPGGLGEAALRALHAEYVEAKRRCNEDASKVTYDGLARTVAKQGPELLAKFNARTVEWKVVVKDGRAILKAIPRS